MIASVRVVDEDTVDFHINREDPLFPGRLVVGILPAAGLAAAHPFERSPVGSGPFRFELWPAAGRLALRRHRDAQVVEFVRVASPTVRVLKLLRGEIDMAQGALPIGLAHDVKVTRPIAKGSVVTRADVTLDESDVAVRARGEMEAAFAGQAQAAE